MQLDLMLPWTAWTKQVDLEALWTALTSKEAGLSVSAVIAAMLAIRYLTKKSVDPSIPGPKAPSFLFGHALESKYGNAVYFREFFTPVVLLSDPKALQHILAIKEGNYPSDRLIRKLARGNLLGETLVSSEGAEHDWHRKMINPHFSLSRVKSFVPNFEKYTTERFLPQLAKAAKSNESFDLNHALEKLTLGIIGAAAFSYDFHENPAVYDAFKLMFAPPSVATYLGLLYIPGYAYLPFPEVRRRRTGRIPLVKALMEVIETKLASKNSPKDLLDLILPNTTPEEALAHTMSFMTAGHENSSSTLGWVVVEISRRPDVVAKMRAECNKVLNKHGSIDSWNAKKELIYTNAVIQETLRLNTVVFTLLRRVALADDSIPMSDGSSIFIPKGTNIEIVSAALHRNPRYWVKPDDFNPERFIPDTPEWIADEKKRGGSSHNFHYLPFSFGSKGCIGQRFATTEMIVILALMITKFDLQVDTTRNLRPLFNGLSISPVELLSV
ncbi:hypothetical protein AeRB84_013813 [Aphanomyces euteiches]|nr:hypothetical protein AeRB84_013813 [Aphanomyces euteiches]